MFNFDESNKVRILPTDTVTEHPDAKGNPTLFVARQVNGKLMACTLKPDHTVLSGWKEVLEDKGGSTASNWRISQR